jgi:MoxR-like ATPase
MGLQWTEIEVLFLAMSKSPRGLRALLHGRPGTSKTWIATHVGLEADEPLWLCGLTEEQLASEPRGSFMPTADGQMGWFDGPVLSWWRTGGRLVLDEIDQISPDVKSFLIEAIQDPDVAAMTLPTGETVRMNREASFKHSIVATMNGVPEDLPEALRDRLIPAIEVVVPHPGAIKTLRQELREAAMKSFACEQPDRYVTLREWQAFSGMLDAGLPGELAARSILGSMAGGFLDSLALGEAVSRKKGDGDGDDSDDD